MSEPVTSAEVEDVLSSIRRLVSEEMRPLQAAESVRQSDRLVLTPALRVAEAAPQEEPQEDPDQAIVEQEVDDPFEHPFDDPAVDATDEGNPQEKLEDDYGADPYNFASHDDEEGDEPEATTFARAQPEPQEATHTDVAEDAPEAEQEEPFDAKAAALSSKIEALEVALGEIEDDFEPEEVEIDDESDTIALAMEWEDDLGEGGSSTLSGSAQPDQELSGDHIEDTIVEDAIIEEALAQVSATPEEEQSFAYKAEDHVIDEETLRDLVSEIVREELQGALGERITRNVRKLVRREIHRALATQDLE